MTFRGLVSRKSFPQRLVAVAGLAAMLLEATVIGVGPLTRPAQANSIHRPYLDTVPAAAERISYLNVNFEAEQFNLCSAKCGKPYDPVDLVVLFATQNNSASVSVNEACGEDIARISRRLDRPAYVYYSKPYTAGCSNTTDARFGNAVFPTGSPYSAQSWKLNSHGEAGTCMPSSLVECRGMVCVVTTTVYTGPWATCSAHLFSTNDGVAIAQASEYIFNVNATYGHLGRWLAGDFNLQPVQMPAAYGNGYYRSTSQYTYTYEVPKETESVDNIWHDRAHSAYNNTATPYCNTYNYSDHCYAFADFG